MSDVTRAGDFWDAEVADPTHSSWMEDLRVRVRINTMTGESELLWPIEWLENVAFGAKDSVMRTTYSLFASRSGTVLRADAASTRARVLDASALSSAEDTWPPPRVPSLWKETKPGEGEWEPVSYGFLKPMRGTFTESNALWQAPSGGDERGDGR